MAEALGRNIPSMNWQAGNLEAEFRRFKLHCQFTFAGPFSKKNDAEKANYIMTWIGDKGRQLYSTFPWQPELPETSTTVARPAENQTPAGIFAK